MTARRELVLPGKSPIIGCPVHVVNPETLYKQTKMNSADYVYTHLYLHSHTHTYAAIIIKEKRGYYLKVERDVERIQWKLAGKGWREVLKGKSDNSILIKTY